jgi:hypothetical protein
MNRLFRIAENNENFPDQNKDKLEGKTACDEQASRGLQNITNKLASITFCSDGAMNSKWSKFTEPGIREQDVDSWHVGKMKAAEVPPETCNISRNEVMPKHAFAQPPSGAIKSNGVCPTDGELWPSLEQRWGVHAGPRKMNEGTGEMRQRVLRVLEDPEKDILEIQV